MIIRPDGPHLLLITQPDHARLSGDLVDAWRADGLPDRPTRSSVVLAAREHDNGWLETDGAPGVKADGRPYSFLESPLDVKQAIWPRGVERLATRDPRAAALLAEHARTVFDRYRGHPAWSAFLDDMTHRRDRLLAAGGSLDAEARAAFDRDYTWVFLGDLWSLVFCHGWTDVHDARGYIARLAGHVLSITPDPFGGRQVRLSVVARRIPDRAYRSTEDLQETLAGAETVMLEGTAAGVGSDDGDRAQSTNR